MTRNVVLSHLIFPLFSRKKEEKESGAGDGGGGEYCR
jgi:hypothetical protein